MLSAAAVFLELDKLIASDTVSLDELGTSVAVSSDGHTVVAGSPAEDGGRGAAYVYERDGESFVETKLTASDGSLFDHFGRSVSVSSDGQTVVVGSPDDDDGPTGWPEDAGAVYVYRSDGSGFLETKLVPSDRSPEFSPYAKFGTSVAISADGQTVVVGSPLVGNDKGMTYLYRWDGESFVETKLNASDAADFDFFGTSVAMSGDGQTVVVGSPGDNDAVEDGGSIYVYQWDGAGFVETELTASDAAGGAQFGASVAISAEGQTVVTGSPADGSGSAYVYRWDGATFAETKLTGGEAASGDRFGSTVTVSADGQTVMIGSPGDRSAGDSGSAYVYQWEAGSFVETKLTASDATAGAAFGSSVGVSGDSKTLVIGSPFNDNGAIYVDQWDADSATFHELKLTAGAETLGDFRRFGNAVAVSGDGQTVVIGRYLDDAAGAYSGSAYVYRWDGAGFVETKLIASDAVDSDRFGTSVAISADGQALVIGATGGGDPRSPSVSAYVYLWNGSSFAETKLTSADAAVGEDFGISVAISDSGQTVVVGSPRDGRHDGAAYVYRWEGAGYVETKLTAPDAGGLFGESVAISPDGQTLVVASRYAPLDETGYLRGAAYVYQWDDDNFVERAKLTASDPDRAGDFASSVAVSADGQTVVVGKKWDTAVSLNMRGAAYVYRWDGDGFVETKLTASDAAEFDHFGTSVAVSADGGRVVVGSPEDDDAVLDSGSVYVYEWDGVSFVETKLTAGDAGSEDHFGASVAVSADGRTMVVGSPLDEGASGSTYVFAEDLTPVQAIEDLIETVLALELPHGIETGMVKELRGAIEKLEDGNVDNDEAAIGKLQEFISKVQEQRGGTLSDEEADLLEAVATDVIVEITEQLNLSATLDEELLNLVAG